MDVKTFISNVTETIDYQTRAARLPGSDMGARRERAIRHRETALLRRWRDLALRPALDIALFVEGARGVVAAGRRGSAPDVESVALGRAVEHLDFALDQAGARA